MSHCKIIIKDEVNVKLEGLDLVTRRKLTNKIKYEIPGARFMPAVKLGRWDGTVSFFSQGGLTYVNLLEDIIPILEQNNYTFDLEDKREQWDLKFDPVQADSFSDVKWPKGHTHEGEPIVLRDKISDSTDLKVHSKEINDVEKKFTLFNGQLHY